MTEAEQVDILRLCLREAGGDVMSGLAAAEYILSGAGSNTTHAAKSDQRREVRDHEKKLKRESKQKRKVVKRKRTVKDELEQLCARDGVALSAELDHARECREIMNILDPQWALSEEWLIEERRQERVWARARAKLARIRAEGK